MKTPEDICPNFSEWPRTWHGVEEDIPYGEGLLLALRPFVEYLIRSGLSARTIRRHMDNLWVLGGEIVRDVSLYEDYDVPPEENLRNSVEEEGGPLLPRYYSEAEVKSFDATCRKLDKFLEQENE